MKKTLGLLLLTAVTLTGCKNHSEAEHGHAHGPNGEHLTEETIAVNQEEFGEDSMETKDESKSKEVQTNEATITVKAGKALEYKFKMNQHEKLEYEWEANTALHYDFHGDPAETDKYPKGYFESYAIGTSKHVKGKVTIPYKGSHGWYWKNTSDKDITITLKTKGAYTIVGLIQ